MEAESSYIAASPSVHWRKGRWIAIAMISVGALLLAFTVGYYLFSTIARARLGELEYSGLLSTDANAVYPGNLLPSVYWDNPRWADLSRPIYNSLSDGFTPVDTTALPTDIGVAPIPTRLTIPSISLSSSIKELEILNLGDARAWETPKHVAGHIPTTARPGEKGNVYLFGHLHSPIIGGGSVFSRLPMISELLKKGEEVFFVVDNENGTSFLYQTVSTTVIHRDDFSLEPSSQPLVILVACVPKYVYDHRLLVTAELVGVKR